MPTLLVVEPTPIEKGFIFPNFRGEKKSLKPPPSYCHIWRLFFQTCAFEGPWYMFQVSNCPIAQPSGGDVMFKPMGWHRDANLTHFWLTLTSHRKVLLMDLLRRLQQASVHRAKPFEDSRRLCSAHEPHGCKHPLFCQIFVLLIVAPPAHPIQRRSI